MIGTLAGASPRGDRVSPGNASERRNLTVAAIVCGLIGAATVAATLALSRTTERGHSDATASIATEEYGRRLLTDTSRLMGPDHADPARRHTGIRMACAACHLGGGTEPGTLSLLQSAAAYPRFSGRDGGVRDLVDRINGCMTRSMNGRALPGDSAEMVAMVAYITSLGDVYAGMGRGRREAHESAAFKTPPRAADLRAGDRVFGERCAICHGTDGAGLQATSDRADGYVFPPLWGADSFNDGAGMHRVLTAARFIKAKMPLGEADLTDDQAFDVAAFINSKPRPRMANLDRDYPDRTTKPIDSPYGPYADDFPIEQHRFGPFAPIEQYYKSVKRQR
jgi:thiosulfate dehydrogenase